MFTGRDRACLFFWISLLRRWKITPWMWLPEQGISNCEFLEGSAEALPFASEQFSLVTSRLAPHHFHRANVFLAEVRRVLTGNGRFVMADQITPSGETLDWVNAWERTRDPSHFDQRTVEQWKLETAKAGFRWIEYQ